MRRALAVAALALMVAVPAAEAAGSALPPTHVVAAHKLDSHRVQVVVRAPGDLTAADVSATLGTTPALLDGVHRIGPRHPLHLVFAIDTSGSMAGAPISAAVAAGQRLLDSVGQGDEVGVVTFASSASVLSPLTANVDAVRNSLAQLRTSSGTALYDGVARAVQQVGSDPGTRRVVIVLSDGADTSSATTLEGLRSQLAAGGVEVDVVGLSASGSFSPAPLAEIAATARGVFVETTSVSGLEPITAKLSQDRLSSEYAVDVELPRSASRELHVSVRGAPPATVGLPAGVSGVEHSLWYRHGNLVVGLLGFAAALMLTLLAQELLGRRPGTLASRLSPYSARKEKALRKTASPALLDLYDMMEARLENRFVWRWYQRLAEHAGVSVHTAQVLLTTIGCGLGLALVGQVLMGPVAAAVGLCLGLALPALLLRYRAARRQRQFEAQLPELLSVWASALRAGRSFAQALDSLVEEASEPARDEFRRAQHQVRLGVPIEQALDDMSRRLRSESFELVVLTTDVQRRIGGNVAEIFDQVAETVRKRHQFASRVRALTAMGVLSSRVLLAMPFVLTGVLTIINRSYMTPLFTTTTGHWMTAAALTMMTLGWLVLRRMVRPRTTA
jgi:tight adherence protein B